MPRKLVHVHGKHGHHVQSLFVVLEDEDSLDAEFEEAGLILTELSGLVPRSEYQHLVASCDGTGGGRAHEERRPRLFGRHAKRTLVQKRDRVVEAECPPSNLLPFPTSATTKSGERSSSSSAKRGRSTSTKTYLRTNTRR